MAGTYYYNSFTGLQRMDGFAGRFFVRQPPEDEPHSELYDYDLTEHSILVQQFAHRVRDISINSILSSLICFTLLS